MTEHLHGKGERDRETQGHRPPTQQAGRRETHPAARGAGGETRRAAAIRIHARHRPKAAVCGRATRACRSAAGLAHSTATWLDNYKAVEWAVAASELGYPKQTDGKRMVKEWRAAQKA